MGVGSQNTFLTYDPYPIARLCCEFQLSKGKTVGGDALQRPKSASKIYLSMDTVALSVLACLVTNWITDPFDSTEYTIAKKVKGILRNCN